MRAEAAKEAIASSASDRVVQRCQDTGSKVEVFLRGHLRALKCYSASARASAAPSISDVGLRLRPFLFRIGLEAFGGSFRAAIHTAAGIELIQISTLVIDDVLDASPRRNGKPSVAAQWGDGTAIALGSLLASEGIYLVGRGGPKGVDPIRLLRVVQEVSRALREVYDGQAMDLEGERSVDWTEAKYTKMISLTTASLIRSSLLSGAVLGGASPAAIRDLRAIGHNIGVAYQLRDDVLDIVGDPACTGKPACGDIRQRKCRLPVVHALCHLGAQGQRRLRALLTSPVVLTDPQVNHVVDLLSKTASVEYVITRTRDYCRAASTGIRRARGLPATLREDLDCIGRLIASF